MKSARTESPPSLRDHAKSEQVQLAATNSLLDRDWGRAPQAILHKADTKEDSPMARRRSPRSISPASHTTPSLAGFPDPRHQLGKPMTSRLSGS
jgi:hypothetical protein